MFLNREFARNWILQKDKWAEGHGFVDKIDFFGTSILYYAFAYMLPAKTAVILGSGSGFVPRLVRQAQREVLEEEFFHSSKCILVDACLDEKGFGKPDYHNDATHYFRITYPEIEIWKITTDQAFEKMREQEVAIDFLHIDADHTYEQSIKDFENYLSLMNSEFIITMHDTARNHLENSLDGCVPRTIAALRKEMEKGGKYEHLEMINFNNRYRNSEHPFKGSLHCRGTAVIKPKTCTVWDTEWGDYRVCCTTSRKSILRIP